MSDLTMVIYGDIEDAEARTSDLQEAYLRRWGWQCTCDFPGAYWVWWRDFSDVDAGRNAWADEHGRPRPRQYGVIYVPKDMAVAITVGTLDERPELAAEDCEG